MKPEHGVAGADFAAEGSGGATTAAPGGCTGSGGPVTLTGITGADNVGAGNVGAGMLTEGCGGGGIVAGTLAGGAADAAGSGDTTLAGGIVQGTAPAGRKADTVTGGAAGVTAGAVGIMKRARLGVAIGRTGLATRAFFKTGCAPAF